MDKLPIGTVIVQGDNTYKVVVNSIKNGSQTYDYTVELIIANDPEVIGYTYFWGHSSIVESVKDEFSVIPPPEEQELIKLLFV